MFTFAAEIRNLTADGRSVVGIVFGFAAAVVVAKPGVEAVLAAVAELECVVPVGKTVFGGAFDQHSQFLVVGRLIFRVV